MSRRSMGPEEAAEIEKLMTDTDLCREDGWREDAACRGYDTYPWFAGHRDHDMPGPTEQEASVMLAEAVKTCWSCPVRLHCLSDCLLSRTRFGVFGGRPPRYRRRLREQVEEVRPDLLNPPCGTSDGWYRHKRDGQDPCDLCKGHRPTVRRYELKVVSNLHEAPSTDAYQVTMPLLDDRNARRSDRQV